MPTMIDPGDITASMIGLTDEEWRTSLKEIEAVMTEAALAQGEVAADFIGIAFTDELIDDNLRKGALERTTKLVNVADEATLNAVQTATRQHIETGGKIPDLARNVQQSVTQGAGRFSAKQRAEVIARTEMTWATNQGAMQTMIQGGVEYQQWWTAQDERTCDFCRPMHGQVIGISSSYWEQGESMLPAKGMSPNPSKPSMKLGFEDVQHPPIHPQCRCSILPYWEDIDGPIANDLNWEEQKENWKE